MIFKGFIASLLFLLTSCGFHLKGDVLLPENLQLIKLQESNDDDFNRYLKDQLKRAGASISEDDNVAFLSVRIAKENEVIVAKSSVSGLEIILLSIDLEYSLKSSSNKWLAQNKTITQTREFESDTNNLLAKTSEKEKVYQQMKLNLSRLLMYQIQLQK